MGTNTLGSAVDGTPIPDTDHNALKEAFGVDIMPRTSSGVPTDVAGSLGTSLLTISRRYSERHFVDYKCNRFTRRRRRFDGSNV